MTSNNNGSEAVYQVDLLTQTSTVLATIPGFIGTYDIVFHNNFLYVTTIEGNYDKVARIDLTLLDITDFNGKTLVVYPNPASEWLHLNGLDQNETLTIIDTHGKVVKAVVVNNEKIDVSELQAGMYFVRHGNVYSKFLKR